MLLPNLFFFYYLCQHSQMFSLLFVQLLMSFSTIFVIVLSWPVLHLMARTTSNQPYDTNIKNYIIYHTLIILYWWKVCEDYLYPTMDWSCNPGVAVALTCALFAALPLVQVGSWPPLIRRMFFLFSPGVLVGCVQAQTQGRLLSETCSRPTITFSSAWRRRDLKKIITSFDLSIQS